MASGKGSLVAALLLWALFSPCVAIELTTFSVHTSSQGYCFGYGSSAAEAVSKANLSPTAVGYLSSDSFHLPAFLSSGNLIFVQAFLASAGSACASTTLTQAGISTLPFPLIANRVNVVGVSGSGSTMLAFRPSSPSNSALVVANTAHNSALASLDCVITLGTSGYRGDIVVGPLPTDVTEYSSLWYCLDLPARATVECSAADGSAFSGVPEQLSSVSLCSGVALHIYAAGIQGDQNYPLKMFAFQAGLCDDGNNKEECADQGAVPTSQPTLFLAPLVSDGLSLQTKLILILVFVCMAVPCSCLLCYGLFPGVFTRLTKVVNERLGLLVSPNVDSRSVQRRRRAARDAAASLRTAWLRERGDPAGFDPARLPRPGAYDHDNHSGHLGRQRLTPNELRRPSRGPLPHEMWVSGGGVRDSRRLSQSSVLPARRHSHSPSGPPSRGDVAAAYAATFNAQRRCTISATNQLEVPTREEWFTLDRGLKHHDELLRKSEAAARIKSLRDAHNNGALSDREFHALVALEDESHEQKDSRARRKSRRASRYEHRASKPLHRQRRRSESGTYFGDSAGAVEMKVQKSHQRNSKRGTQSKTSIGQCAICLDAPAEYLVLPCGHQCGCFECLTSLKNLDGDAAACPICRTLIDGTIVKVFQAGYQSDSQEVPVDIGQRAAMLLQAETRQISAAREALLAEEDDESIDRETGLGGGPALTQVTVQAAPLGTGPRLSAFTQNTENAFPSRGTSSDVGLSRTTYQRDSVGVSNEGNQNHFNVSSANETGRSSTSIDPRRKSSYAAIRLALEE